MAMASDVCAMPVKSYQSEAGQLPASPRIFSSETIKETLTLLSYRLSMLNCASKASDHGARNSSFSTRNFPIQETDLPRPRTRRCMGLLAVPRARGRLARTGHEHGRIVHRNAATQGRGRPDQIAFSCARGADQGRRRGEACKIRCWIGIEIHRAERARPA